MVTENDALIEEMLNRGTSAPEPGAEEDRVIHKGDDNIPMPIVRSSLTSAGYTYIYDTRTGERSVTNNNMLRAQLRKKRPDGSRVFTTIKPSFEPEKGQFKCLLHPKDPNRAHYDYLGLPVCHTAHIPSPFHVRQHMQKRHRVEWQVIEEERKEQERQDDKQFQREVLMGVRKAVPVPTEVGIASGVSGEAPLYVSDKPKRK